MTKAKLEAYRRLYNRLEALGFDGDEVDALCRIERTLSRWSELECGDGNDYASWSIERDENTGKPYMHYLPHHGKSSRRLIADREAGALRRLAAIMSSHPKYIAYHQTDPRGCALYIVPNEYLPDGTDIRAVYNSGIAVCV
jgi:hypothetical protein